ncbi:hypothetical protein GEMRC1_009165 [Eukaryota sp. GEM-RC1]
MSQVYKSCVARKLSLLGDTMHSSTLDPECEEHINNSIQQLRDYQAHKKKAIQNICDSHHQEFLASVSNLLATKNTANSLRSELVALSSKVQHAGDNVSQVSRQLIDLRRAQFNVGLSLQHIKAMYAALEVYSSANEAMKAKDYLLAVSKLNLLEEVLLPRIEGTFIKNKLDSFLSELRQDLQSTPMTELNTWLDNTSSSGSRRPSELTLQCSEIGKLVVNSFGSSSDQNDDVIEKLDSLLSAAVATPARLYKVFLAIGQAKNFKDHLRNVSSGSIVKSGGHVPKYLNFSNLLEKVYSFLGVLCLFVTISNQVPDLASCFDIDSEWGSVLHSTVDKIDINQLDDSRDNVFVFNQLIAALVRGAVVLKLKMEPLTERIQGFLLNSVGNVFSTIIKNFRTFGCEFYKYDDNLGHVIDGSKMFENEGLELFYNSDVPEPYYSFSPLVPQILDAFLKISEKAFEYFSEISAELNSSFDLVHILSNVLVRAVDQKLLPLLKILISDVYSKPDQFSKAPNFRFFKHLMILVDLDVLNQYFPNIILHFISLLIALYLHLLITLFAPHQSISL